MIHMCYHGWFRVLCKHRQARQTDCLIPLIRMESSNESVWLACVYTVPWISRGSHLPLTRKQATRSLAYFRFLDTLMIILLSGEEWVTRFKKPTRQIDPGPSPAFSSSDQLAGLRSAPPGDSQKGRLSPREKLDTLTNRMQYEKLWVYSIDILMVYDWEA